MEEAHESGSLKSWTREDVLLLIDEKERIEGELNENKTILDEEKVGMHDSLVDTEGYPLHGIDIYKIRHARHRIICLQNDHKDIMKKIEEGLNYLHSQTQESIKSNVPPPVVYTDPFFKIGVVTPRSPAEEAGLKRGDLIIEFGNVNITNFKNFEDIKEVVKNSINQRIRVKLQRADATKLVSLIPHIWEGKGLLGCHILPTEALDR